MVFVSFFGCKKCAQRDDDLRDDFFKWWKISVLQYGDINSMYVSASLKLPYTLPKKCFLIIVYINIKFFFNRNNIFFILENA